MILLVDRGNTRLKWRLIEGGELIFSGLDDDEFTGLGARVSDLPLVSVALIACVAGSAKAELLALNLRRIWPNIEIVTAATLSDFKGFRPAYSDTLGVDRWLQLLSAHSVGRFPALVLSIGTAITVDRLDAAGCHEGGLIAPGWPLLRSAVQGGTASVDARVPLGLDSSGLGLSTGACVHKGVSHLICAYLQRVDEVFGAGASCKFVTGGDAAEVARYLEGYSIKENLVLDGLAVVAHNLEEYRMQLDEQRQAGC